MGSIFGSTTKPQRNRTYSKRPVFGRDTNVPRKPNDADTNVAIKKHPKQREENLQLRICNYVIKQYPEAIIVTDFAGLELSKSQRQKMMRMRSEKGHPDISIDFPSRGYHGLRIELKAEGTVVYKRDGTLRKSPYKREYIQGNKKIIYRGDHLEEQEATLKKYLKMGYFARFGIGYDKTVQLIDWYFNNNTTLF